MTLTLTDLLNLETNVMAFSGVVGDGVHDDTAGIQVAIDAAAARAGTYTPGALAVEGWQPTVVFPAGKYLINDALVIGPYTRLKGLGQAVIIQANAAKDIIVSTDFRRNEFHNLTLYGGINQIELSMGTTSEPAMITIDHCGFYAGTGYAVYASQTSGGSRLHISNSWMVRCKQFLYNALDTARVSDTWIEPYDGYGANDTAQIVNYGQLALRGITGVPANTAYSTVRWIDNYNSVHISGGCRFGGEGGGIPIVYQMRSALAPSAAWATGTVYAVGDYVHGTTDLLRCIVAHTSTTGGAHPDPNVLYWRTGIVYVIGDWVTASGNIYECTVNHTSGPTHPTPPGNTTDWTYVTAASTDWQSVGSQPYAYATVGGAVTIRDSWISTGSDSRVDKGAVVFKAGPPNVLVIEGCAGVHGQAAFINTKQIGSGPTFTPLANLFSAMNVTYEPNMFISIKNNVGWSPALVTAALDGSSDEDRLRPWMENNSTFARGLTGSNIETRIPIKTYSAYAAGTPYQLTITPALLTFGTTSPSIILTARGSYLIKGYAKLDYNAATFAAVRTATLKFRRTNNTAADLANSTHAYKTGIVTTITETFIEVSFEVLYTTPNADDVIEIWGSLDVVPSAGSLDAAEAYIMAVRI